MTIYISEMIPKAKAKLQYVRKRTDVQSIHTLVLIKSVRVAEKEDDMPGFIWLNNDKFPTKGAIMITQSRLIDQIFNTLIMRDSNHTFTPTEK